MKKGMYRRLWPYVVRFWPYLVGSALGALVSVPLFLLLPVIAGLAIDQIAGPGHVDFPAIARLLGLFALCTGLHAATSWLMSVCTRITAASAAEALRQDSFDRINTAPLSNIDKTPHGDLASRVVNDAEDVSEGVMQALSGLLPGLVTLITTMIFMLLLDVQIALLVIVVTPLSVLPARFLAVRSLRYFKGQAQLQGDMGAFVSEMVTRRTQVAALGCQVQCQAAFEAINEPFATAGRKAVFYASLGNPTARFVNYLIYAAVAVFGGISVIGGALTIGSLSAFLAYAAQYTRPFNEGAAVLTQIQSAQAAAKRLFHIIDWPAEPKDAPDAKRPSATSGLVRFTDISFSYTPDRPVLAHVSFTAKPGDRIALVGPTGSGKTTLMNLLMRFYEPDQGAIAIDNIPICNMDKQSLRNLCGMVLQESFIQQATVRENIAYGRQDASMSEIEAAARAASAHSFITGLAEGYETVIGGADGLSEGQKQLICIARIFLTKPAILLLDEATSAIDTRTELQVQEALQNLMKGRTSFIVAHRLATIQKADQILVLDHGRVIESGKHAELLAKNGLYAQLVHSQFGSFESYA